MEEKPNIEKQAKKKNKKKKKAASAANNIATACPTEAIVDDKVPETVPLPKNVNDKTYFKEIEVTFSQTKNLGIDSNNSETAAKNLDPALKNSDTATKSSKKKKKSSASKNTDPSNSASDKSKETNKSPDDADPGIPLLHFSRDSTSVLKLNNTNNKLLPNVQEASPAISNVDKQNKAPLLINLSKEVLEKRPEISICVAQNPEIPSPNLSTNEQSQGGSTNSSKKRKKKKKSQSISESKDISSGDGNVNAVKNHNEESTTSSSYIKLPTNDEKCVLIVSGPSLENTTTSNSTNDFSTTKSQANDAEYNLNNLRNTIAADIKPSVTIIDSSKNVLLTSHHNTVVSPITPDPKISGKLENKASKEAANVAKAAKKSGANKDSKSKGATEATKMEKAPNVEKKRIDKQAISKDKATFTTKFTHLPTYKSLKMLEIHLKSNSTIHPAVLAFGIQCAERVIDGSDARCVAFLASLKEVIEDYTTPPNKELCRDLETKFESCTNFVAKCRPLSVSMQNAMKFLKYHLTNMPPGTSDTIAKRNLSLQIGKFVQEEIILAQEAISNNAAAKIVNGDIILTYSFSSVVTKILLKAWKEHKIFKVIIVDSRPKLDGKKLLKFLLELGIDCSYILIGAVSYVMKYVTKVLVGAHSLHANGYVMSRIGCSQIALVASWYNVPFLVCCETYKFCERVHTDSLSHNELGNPECFGKTEELSIVKTAKETSQLQLLNLLYDLTPPHLVSMVITEKGMLPCTSVPVVLRVRHACALDDQTVIDT